MEIIAQSRFVRVAPRKARLVADLVKQLPLVRAQATLRFLGKRAASPIGKTLNSAVANALNTKNAREEDLYIKAIKVDEGPAFKRFHAVSRGMAHGYKKRTSHITVVLATRGPEAVQKQVKQSTRPEIPDSIQSETIRARKNTAT